MSNVARERAKEHFPTVLLTLLSIVQAIALELLWGHISESSYLYASLFTGVFGWLQLASTLLGIVLIWVVYASNVMRFRWVPSTADSIYPFAVGIFEFWLVSSLGPGSVALWLLAMATCVGCMTYVSHATMRRARLDPDNAEFFTGIPRATLADFYPHVAFVLLMIVFATASHLLSGAYYINELGILVTAVFLVGQFVSASYYWSRTIARVDAD